ncbi:MAG TPA: hypothetical protein VK157_00405 [Phycisphaerales bacterium]|nr:hypothetical protein [Phycisphaerales bacterium]
MWQTIKNLFITTFVAAFVWVFAESETLREQKMTARLTLTTPAQARYSFVTGTDTRDVTVDVWLQTNSSRMESVERRLRTPLEVLSGAGSVPIVPGPYTLDLGEVLRENADLAELGVSVRRVEPATLNVVIDELETREVSVRLPSEITAALGATAVPVISPPTVKITMPSRDIARLAPQDAVTIAMPMELLERLPGGKSETLRGLSLRPPFEIRDAEKLSISPAKVDVTLTKPSRGTELTLSQIPVYVRVEPDQLARWNIQIAAQDQFLTNVRVVGPEELVEQVRNRTLPITALVSLSVADLERGITAQVVEFPNIPEGLKVESPTRSVRVNVTRR